MDNPKLTTGEHVIKPKALADYEEAKRIRAHLNQDDPCPWCTQPEGHDACPIHSNP
ncbi:hypothetical protein [Glycomyces sp. NPDC021274]|uniref:hypothetical protein n=1 Tax=Glycomyces sp. NPDC021274 TaxID=3155120 RepID=UPI00340CD79A